MNKAGMVMDCELPASGTITLTYYVRASPRTTVHVTAKLLTGRMLPLDSRSEFLRWDPKLGNPASSEIQEGGQQ
jgi:hypothetical protein